MSEPHRIVAGGCTNLPPMGVIRPRRSGGRVEREPTTEKHLARRIWRALRRGANLGRPRAHHREARRLRRQSMMRLVWKPLLVAFHLLTSAATAHAECA